MARKLLVLACVAGLAALAAPDARAANERDLPRYASIRAERAYLRTGPGSRYPVDWVYTRRDLPVEIVAEFDTWRRVRDWQGTVGWMHSSVLSTRRSVVITEARRPLRREPDEASPEIAKLEPGVIARLLTCDAEWCRIEVGAFRGWLKRGWFWGVRVGEKVE